MAKAEYPKDHQAGMAVPRGGSMCANCEYLKDARNGLCGNEYFVKWNGSEKIPGKINEYCSDFYEPASREERPEAKVEVSEYGKDTARQSRT